MGGFLNRRFEWRFWVLLPPRAKVPRGRNREILRLGFFNSRLIICINFRDTILTNNEYLVTVISVSEEEQVVCAICYDFCFYKIKSTIDNCAYKGNHFSEIDQSLFPKFCK